MIPTQELCTGVINTDVFEVTNKIVRLACLAGHPEDTQKVLNILFGVESGKKPLSPELLDQATQYTWTAWYQSDERYSTEDTPMEQYLNKFRN